MSRYIVFAVHTATIWSSIEVEAKSKREAATKVRSEGALAGHGIDTGYEKLGPMRVRGVEGPDD